MSDYSPITPISNEYLTLLKQKLAQVTGSWAIDDYHAFITFYSRILPSLMNVERCTVFIMEMGDQKICSIFGTGLKEQHIKPPLEGSIVGTVIQTGISRRENNLSVHQGYHSYMDEQTGFISRNMICAPIKSLTGNSVSGAIQLLNKTDDQLFTRDDLTNLEEIAHYLSISIESIVLNQEILRIAASLGEEVERLEQNSVKGTTLIAESPAMRETLDLVRIVSKTPVNVLIQGENGTGKELIAHMIHQYGDRRDQPFVAVNCTCIPESLVESAFFGHEKGAFTGADSARQGLFEEVSGGTMFLDEIGEMPLMIQPKILRAIQEEEGSRVGSNKTIQYNLRLVSATNRDLAKEMKRGRFREDLFFRLFSVEIILPPLRERKEDILPLALHFLQLTNERFDKNVSGFSSEVLNLFDRFPWPGNVRQLIKEIERLVALTEDGQVIRPDHCSRELLSFYNDNLKERGMDENDLAIPAQTRRLEIDLINKAMNQTGGNKSQAAKLLNITRQGLLKKIKRYEIQS